MPSGTIPVANNSQGMSTELRWGTTDEPQYNRSLVTVELWAVRSSATTSGNGSWTLYINGVPGSLSAFRSIAQSWTWIMTHSGYIYHDAAGVGSAALGVSGGIAGSSWTATSGGGTVALTDYAMLPNAPSNMSIRAGSVKTTSFGVDYVGNATDTILQDESEWATDAAFTNIVWRDGEANGYTDPSVRVPPTQLAPGTTHYVRLHSRTAAGWGPYSGTISQATLPAVPPGLTVATSPSGTQATLTFSPPGGVTGVTKYTWERRPTPAPQTPVVTGDSTTAIAVVGELIPGNSYDWRASAWIGTYQSPWSTWQTLVQARPNVNPGDYYDGSTPDSADLDYAWSGGTGTSTSTATAVVPDGWEVEFANGTGFLMRATAGLFSVYAARVVVTVDATGAGQRFGQKDATPYWSDVTPAAVYVGSIHVKPSRSQRVAAEITWLNAAGALISRSAGTAVVAAANVPTRLSVTATAPALAEWAVTRVIDVTGTGWSTWKGGDIVDLDAAMVTLNDLFPYFDGDTLFDGTYVYEWVDPAQPHASTSKRTPLELAEPGTETVFARSRSLLDPDCIPPSPPRPPVIPNACVTEAGVWRRVFGTISAGDVPDHLDAVPTFEIVTVTSNVEQVRIRIYPNPAGVAPSQIDLSHWTSEQIVSFVPKDTVLTLDGVHQRVYAEVSGGDPISADHLLYGSNGTPASWPVLSCGIDYVISVDLPIEVPQGDSRVLTYLTTRY